MAEAWSGLLARWTDAGVLDENSAARIREFEHRHAASGRLRWPIWLALVFGALTSSAGVLLFVSAHWDEISPAARFALTIALVALFHVGGALAARRFPAMAVALHAIGTVVLGAGIFLAGQIFHLDEHGPGGLMLWAPGAAFAWLLLRAWPQTALLALLAPAWLVAEWVVVVENLPFQAGGDVAFCGIFLLALTYFTAIRPKHVDADRRTLVWIGAIVLLLSAKELASGLRFDTATLPRALWVTSWSVALGLPLVIASALRRAGVWPNFRFLVAQRQDASIVSAPCQ